MRESIPVSPVTGTGKWVVLAAVALGAVALGTAACSGAGSLGQAAASRHALSTKRGSAERGSAERGSPETTSTTLPPPGPGFVPGRVTAVGDSVMIDYEQPLEFDIPGVSVNAAVSRQWSDGEAILQQLKAARQLGAIVIVALGTNGELSASDFDTMMSILSGASRVIFVNVHVDQPYQDQNNAVLAQGVSRYPNTVLVDWESLAAANPQWFGADGTHLAINGPGAQALAALIASKVKA